jgi:hypothetical protein
VVFRLLRKPTSIPNDALKSTSTCNHKHTDSCFHQSTARMHPLADLRHITTSSPLPPCAESSKGGSISRPRTRVLVRRTVRTASKIKRSKRAIEQSSEDQTLPNVFYLFQTIEEVLWSFETLDTRSMRPFARFSSIISRTVSSGFLR